MMTWGQYAMIETGLSIFINVSLFLYGGGAGLVLGFMWGVDWRQQLRESRRLAKRIPMALDVKGSK